MTPQNEQRIGPYAFALLDDVPMSLAPARPGPIPVAKCASNTRAIPAAMQQVRRLASAVDELALAAAGQLRGRRAVGDAEALGEMR
jgi:hypothetical protein